MRMHNPPHPGAIIKALCLEPLGVTVTQAAEQHRKQLRVAKLAV
jgi:plasmid maintenance system antidote protein VapI